MPLYSCRWPNGDVSFVYGTTKLDAIEILDEVGEADETMLRRVRDFAIHMKLSDSGNLEFESWGECTHDHVAGLYPLLKAVLSEAFRCGADEPEPETLTKAVKAERERVKNTHRHPPGSLEALLGMHPKLVDRIRKEAADSDDSK